MGSVGLSFARPTRGRCLSTPLSPSFRLTKRSATGNWGSAIGVLRNCTLTVHSMATPTKPSTSNKIGHGLAEVLRIKLDYRNPTGKEDLTRGESAFSVSSADTYVEEEPTVAEWLRNFLPTGPGVLHYLIRLFPFLSWISRYNVQWLFGDLVAGMLENNRMTPPIPQPDPYRYHRWRRRRPPGDGVCFTCPASPAIRSLLFIYGGNDILVLCYVKGHNYRGKPYTGYALLACR